MSKQIAAKLIVITGKTASGKDTLITKILKKYPDFRKVLTTTSRAPRNGEKNGVDYNFISRAEFRRKIEQRDFLEYVEYGGNFYGTEKSQINPKNNLIWKIDPSRAGKIRQLIKRNLVVIYINTSDDVILQRLKDRGLSDMEIKRRMQNDQKFWNQFREKYDYIVENIPGKLDQTIEQIVKIIDSHL